MNNYCLLNTFAAIVFKWMLKDGISVLVLTLFRSVVLGLFSFAAVVFLKPDISNSSSSDSVYKSIPIKLFDSRFLLAQARAIFGTISFLLFVTNLSLIPMTLIIIVF